MKNEAFKLFAHHLKDVINKSVFFSVPFPPTKKKKKKPNKKQGVIVAFQLALPYIFIFNLIFFFI